MKWLVEIEYEVTQKGGFLNEEEAMKFIPSYLFKHADESIKPHRFDTKIHRWCGDYDHVDFYFTLSYVKEFPDFSDLILWVDEVERNLGKYFEEHKEIFRNAVFRRTRHRTYKQEQKRSFFSTKNVWVQV